MLNIYQKKKKQNPKIPKTNSNNKKTQNFYSITGCRGKREREREYSLNYANMHFNLPGQYFPFWAIFFLAFKTFNTR